MRRASKVPAYWPEYREDERGGIDESIEHLRAFGEQWLPSHLGAL
jgi:hypothetical protein